MMTMQLLGVSVCAIEEIGKKVKQIRQFFVSKNFVKWRESVCFDFQVESCSISRCHVSMLQSGRLDFKPPSLPPSLPFPLSLSPSLPHSRLSMSLHTNERTTVPPSLALC